MEKLKKMMGAFANIHNVYFKILFKPKETSQVFENNIKNNIEKYLTILEKEDLIPFLNNLGLFVQSYDIKFLTNNLDQYFLKVEILQPSFKRLIQNRTIECMVPNCNDIIVNKNYNLCVNHLDDSLINNSQLMTTYFNQHIQKTKEIYNNYNNQKDIYSFLVNKYQDNIDFMYLSENFKNINCILELFKYDDKGLNKTKLIEIELSYKVNKLKFKTLYNDTHSDSDSDSDSDSESGSDNEDDLNTSNENCNQDSFVDLLTNNSDNINESYNNTITRINYIHELENKQQIIKNNNLVNDIQIKSDISNLSNLSDIMNDNKSEIDSDTDFDTDSNSELDESDTDSILNSDSDLSNLDFDSDVDLNELNELAKELRMLD